MGKMNADFIPVDWMGTLLSSVVKSKITYTYNRPNDK